MFFTLFFRSIFCTLVDSFLVLIARYVATLRIEDTLNFGGTSTACFGGLLLWAGLILGVLPELIALFLLCLDVKDKDISTIILFLLPGIMGSSTAL